MRRLSAKQYEVYQYIASYIDAKGYSPLASDIVTALKLDIADVKYHISDLCAQGYLTYLTNTSRMLYLTEQIPHLHKRNLEPVGSQSHADPKQAKRKPYKVGNHRQAVYNYIGAYVETHQYPPAIRDIAKGLDIGATTAKYYVDLLRDQGYLSYLAGKSRSIRLTNKVFSEISDDCRKTTEGVSAQR